MEYYVSNILTITSTVSIPLRNIEVEVKDYTGSFSVHDDKTSKFNIPIV